MSLYPDPVVKHKPIVIGGITILPAYTTTYAPTQDFELAVLTMLRNEGFDDVQIAPLFQSIVHQMWDNSHLRKQYEDMAYPTSAIQTPATPAQMAATFTKLLDTQPQFRAILVHVLQYKLDQGIPLSVADEKRLSGILKGSPTTAAYAAAGIYNRTDLIIYAPIASLWKSVFGRDPTTAQLQDVINHGKTEQQYEDYVRSLPYPHIPGMNVGQYIDTRGAADKVSSNIYGHPANDAIVKELFNAGMGNAHSIQTWYDNLEATRQAKKDATLYNTAYSALAPHTNAVFNQVPDPRVVAALINHGKAQMPPEQATPPVNTVPASDAAAAADQMVPT